MDLIWLILLYFLILELKKKENILEQKFPRTYSEDYKLILLTDKQYVRVQEDGMYRIEEV